MLDRGIIKNFEAFRNHHSEGDNFVVSYNIDTLHKNLQKFDH